MSDETLEGWREFVRFCAQEKDRQTLEDFFALFLTYEERVDLAKRILIVQELLRGSLTQRELAEKFGVSISKITRGSNALKIADPKLKNLLIKNL